MVRLSDLHEVEATAVATFTSTGVFHVRYGEATVAYLPIEFLHDGVPQLELESAWSPPQLTPFSPPVGADHGDLLLRMLRRPNIASKETWVRQYDHEVIAQTAIKPFVGTQHGIPPFVNGMDRAFAPNPIRQGACHLAAITGRARKLL